MNLALEIDVPHLFIWDPIFFADTPFAINRVVILMFVSVALCLGFFLYGAAKKALVPKGASNLAETAYLFVRNNIAIDVIGPEGAKYAGYLASVFFFILFCNFLAIFPGIGFAPTSRMAIPFLLAMLTWLIFNIVGLVKQGPLRYFKDTLFPPGVPWLVYVLLAPIELFSVFIVRPLTLMVRLLANMMAGHVLLAIFFLFTHDLLVENIGPAAPLGVVTLAVGVALMMLELLVIGMQAYIFTMLSAFYIAEAVHGHGDHDEHEEEEVGGAHGDPAKGTPPQREAEMEAA
ncbi:MAG: F0F1 ATP synthase subunit A [Actinomycetota bacterium]|nr:F0F1 ATP synthase subunit A [Actinomycetota bacterium]